MKTLKILSYKQQDTEILFSPVARGGVLLEMIKFERGESPLFERHYARLSRSLSLLKPDCLLPAAVDLKKEILRYLEDKKKRAGITAVRLRVAPWNGFLAFEAVPYRYTEKLRERGFHLTFAPYRRYRKDPLWQHKTGNALANILALDKAKMSGHDETLWLNTEGRLCEGSYTNLFIEKNGRIVTPPLSEGVLPGVMRAHLIQYAKKQGFPIDIVRCPQSILDSADRVYVTNALMGIMPVRAVQNKSYRLSPTPFFQACVDDGMASLDITASSGETTQER